MFTRFSSSLRSTARAAAPSTRGYATASTSATSNSAPYFLGAGLAGAAAFYYSTLDQRQLLAEQRQGTEKTPEGTTKVKGESALSPEEFRSFKLAEVLPYNYNTSRFIFDLPDGTSSGLTVASALVVKATKEGEALGKNGKPVIRPYTPTTAPDVEGKLGPSQDHPIIRSALLITLDTQELLIKHYPGGAMTEHIFKLKPGDELAIKGPIPKFPYKANEFESIALIAGGSGITPMWQILQAINAQVSPQACWPRRVALTWRFGGSSPVSPTVNSNPEDKTKATLIFANVTEEDILLRKEFEGLAKSKPDQFSVVFPLDKPPANWTGPTGYVNSEVLEAALKGFGTGPEKKEKVKVFVCGPPGQMKAISGTKKSMKEQGPVEGVLKELGYTEEQVYKF
ncbi:SPOSA6832_04213 [Sporobolomyces salmonicolor]|uniref:cytochrome-b5 reductase n=1 Tax=Sporidiobolus salmonicolor TaxID=5005 RepID=A0A0D6EQP1_SPOSA|nr:SPOSA6832_04213 [Sporobolomyces salmonicolor]